MMNAKDIQIGDWLHLHYCNKFDGEVHKNFRVAQIRDDYGELCVWAEKTETTRGNMGALNPKYGKSHIDPIPLTKEILEKNFEKKTFYGIYDDYFDLDIRQYSDSIYVVTFHNCEMSFPDQSVTLSFVHELQHFLRHCGIEYEIKL